MKSKTLSVLLWIAISIVSYKVCYCQDSLDNMTDYTIFNPQDLSSSFNERGYMKSSSVSFDEKEIINDFNGNLMYKIPIASGKGKGDLHYDLSLNYNGNVNYRINTSDLQAQNWFSGQLHEYNMSAPGWIISFNGFAVQMLNFEDNFFTRAPLSSATLTQGKNVKLLATGYQITDQFNTGGKNKITIMLGDGSTETLENTIPDLYVGNYRSTSKDSYVKAEVVFMEDEGPPDFSRRRKMFYMNGDGLTYIFEETEVAYKDLQYHPPVVATFRPLVFMLKGVMDRFGNNYGSDDFHYKASYEDDYALGRPWLDKCPGANFVYQSFWGTNFGFGIDTKDGRYLLYTQIFATTPGARKRVNLEKLLNPSGEYMKMQYAPYTREASGLYKHSSQTFGIGFNFGFNSEPLYRLVNLTNFDGGQKLYSYYDEGLSVSNISYILGFNERGAHSSGASYLGQGRDLFFTNSLGSVRTLVNGAEIRKEKFDYSYVAGRSDVWEKPINENDEYYSVRTIYDSLSLAQNNGMETKKTSVKLYRNYPRAFSSSHTTDYDGILKIEKDESYLGEENSAYHIFSFEYDKGVFDTIDHVYNGSFFETKKKEQFGSNFAEWNTSYTFFSNDEMPLLTSKTVTDPNGKKDSTTFIQFFPSYYTYNVFKNGICVYFDLNNLQAFDTARLYLVQVPALQFTKKNNVILAKQENIYYNDTSITDQNNIKKGYPGQLAKTKIYNANNLSDFLTTEYTYSNIDSTGKHLYIVAGFKVSNEGNIKEIKDPKGNKTRYYNDLISRSEDKSGISDSCGSNTDEIACAPHLTYKQMNDNGTITLQRSNWRDPRLPTRIDRYIDGSNFITNYQIYDDAGNPTGIVDNNNYFTKISYDKYYRLAQATLPYDFNSMNSIDTIPRSDTTIVDVQLISNSQYWGFHRMDTSIFSYSNSPGNAMFVATNGYRLGEPEDEIPLDPEDTTSHTDAPQYFTPYHQRGIIKINNTGFQNIAEIDSAFIEFAPSVAFATHDSAYFTNFNIRLIPLKLFGPSTTYEVGNQYLNMGNLNLSRNIYCNNDSMSIAKFDSNFRKVNITQLLRDNISNGALNIQGFEFDLTENGGFGLGIVEMLCNFFSCNINYQTEWMEKYLPKVKIYGRQKFISNYKVLKFNNGTIAYDYDDLSNKISVSSKIDGIGSGSRYKKVTNYFDGLRRIYHTKTFTDSLRSDSAKISYNYIDGKSVVTDGRGNITRYKYDRYGNIDSTSNADNSYTLGSTVYQNGLSYRFGTVSGLVQKQSLLDEEGHKIEKYTDALGNLRREVRFIDDSENSTPETIPGIIELITDYHYDDLYRVDSVKTPEGKVITYFYDGFGRQIKRTTPDAGRVEYRYDANNNLIYSQDENQRDISNYNYTFRNYDGLNRLLYIGEADYTSGTPDFDAADTTDPAALDNINGITSLCLTINVYDTLSSAAAGEFTAPSDYGGTLNNTRGNLAATAYRTRKSDNWNYKFYRYDARGRVIRMWNVIDGLGTKTTDYLYNSQNQVQIFTYQQGSEDEKRTKYTYDDAGRLSDVHVLMPQAIQDTSNSDNPSTDYFGFAKYKYNQNSQIDTLMLNRQTNIVSYEYNNRNWINYQRNNLNLFVYGISYFSNGNIYSTGVVGNYKGQFSDTNSIVTVYSYDKANRLISAAGTTGYINSLTNAYDLDGNITSLVRSSATNSSDNFTYNYISGTNKLAKVLGSDNQYTYDYNGNMKTDEINKNYDAVYDYRNLLIYLSSVRFEDPIDSKKQTIYVTRYYYDEAGNRVRKIVFKRSSEIEPTGDPDWDNPEGDASGWGLVTDEFYVRDAAGKEIADYNSGTLSFWNIYGSDNVGRVNADTTKQFYLKDHLGTTRAAVDASNTQLAAYDFDAWGYKLREWNSGENAKYRFTGKERDIETNYDYFGARYYDARIGRWGGTEPKYDKYPGFSPYGYAFNNVLKTLDLDGLDIVVVLSGYTSSWFGPGGTVIPQEKYSTNSNASGYLQVLGGVSQYAKENNLDVQLKGFYSTDNFSEKEDVMNFITSSLEQNPDQKVIVYGYSQGGHNALDLTEALNNKGISVSELVVVDGYNGNGSTFKNGGLFPFATNDKVSENVFKVNNYFQRKPDITGAHGRELFAKGPITTIVSNEFDDVSHADMDEATAWMATKNINNSLSK